jgi:hypothetical protein
MDVEVAVIFTEGIRTAFTVMVMPALVAGLPVAQGVALDVKITVTTCPLVSVVVVNVLLFVPAFTPFTCH